MKCNSLLLITLLVAHVVAKASDVRSMLDNLRIPKHERHVLDNKREQWNFFRYEWLAEENRKARVREFRQRVEADLLAVNQPEDTSPVINDLDTVKARIKNPYARPPSKQDGETTPRGMQNQL